MCGIVGYIGPRDAVPVLMAGLKRLEYRGYDSAGVAVVQKNALQIVRCRGKLGNLAERLEQQHLQGAPGIGHTRWATHGRPSDENAHPHSYGGVAVVHNGIIENHLTLKAELRKKGHLFSSETDSEIFAHLIADEVAAERPLPDAVRAALGRARGTYAIAVLCEKDPSTIVCAKNSSPLVLGMAPGECFLASDVPALLDYTREVIFLEEGDFAVLTRDGIAISDRQGKPIQRLPRQIDWTPVMAEKGGHKHFMHKEIVEQPRAVADTIRGRASIEEGDAYLEGLDRTIAQEVRQAVILACGTSYHAGLVGRTFLETLAKLPVSVELASEFRNREPLIDSKTLVIAISQSGETADTLGALREAKAQGAFTLAITNVVGSAIAREAQAALYTHAGPEIGVASTKCFTTQLAALYLLAVKLGRGRGVLDSRAATERLEALRQIPTQMKEVLRCEEKMGQLAQTWLDTRDCLYLGRGIQYPIALEGALKLKEISYVHAEGYAAGEMKHGPIALIEPSMPVVVLATQGPGYEKMIGNIEEVRARSGKVIALVTEGDRETAALADCAIEIPPCDPLLAPFLTVLPLQLFAYQMADRRGNDVDQPRNLAKSVTVE